jgi:hypothetical protein
VGLAAPLSLLPCGQERAAWGSRPPTPRRVLPGGVGGRTPGAWGWYLSGLYKKLRRAREEAVAAAVRLPSPPTPCPGHLPSSFPPPAPSPARGLLALVAPGCRPPPLPLRVKGRFSFLTWCRAKEGEQWRRDTPLPPPRAGAGQGGRATEAGREPKSGYPEGGRMRAWPPAL